MRLIYCTKCRFVANKEIELRMSTMMNCNCHSELQRLAAREPDGVWALSDRARTITVPEELLRQTTPADVSLRSG